MLPITPMHCALLCKNRMTSATPSPPTCLHSLPANWIRTSGSSKPTSLKLKTCQRPLGGADISRRPVVSRLPFVLTLPKDYNFLGEAIMSDQLVIAGRAFNSRLIVGTGKYRSFQEMARAHAASGADMVTVAVRRVNLTDKSKESLLDYIDREKL